MWFDPDPIDDRWAEATEHLRRDKVLRPIIDQVGPCTLRPKPGYFAALVKSILAQQVSTAAATSMFRKLRLSQPRGRLTPAGLAHFLATASDEQVRGCGLSRQKRGYMVDLARAFTDGSVPVRRLPRMTDEEVVAALTPIKGIGRWTVEMLLMFSLARPDVWPVDDLGIREALFRFWPDRFRERPKPKEVVDFADPWRPYRSVASWYLWRGKGE